jgi:hypothetical protein
MADGTADLPQADEPGAGPGHLHDGWLASTGWSALHGRPGAPPWMRAELVRLRAAFPAFSFTICSGWRGLMFEAWRDSGAGGLYAVITQDAGDLWRELEESQTGPRPVPGACGKETR